MLRIILFLFFFSNFTFAQTLNFQTLSDEYGRKYLPTLLEYISLPCDANFPEDIAKNYDWTERHFVDLGFVATKITTPTLPLLFLEKKSSKPNAKTLLLYYHSDGQPVVRSQWNQKDPFVPELKALDSKNNTWNTIPMENLKKEINPEWRIFARASSDDKGPGVMLMAALDALQAQKHIYDFNIKLLVDFEEEKGSASLPEIIESNKKMLYSDLLLIFDGPAHASNLPTLTFGARGIVTFSMSTYGPKKPQHSGHYGNYAPNPVFRMAKLLATMKDEEGKVLIPGFYDGIKPSASLLKEISEVPDDLVQLNKTLGINKAEKVGKNYQESLMYPSLNVRGIKSAEVGALAATIIPDLATAEIDIRTVTASDPLKLLENVKKHIEKQGYYIIDRDPTDEERLKYDKICKFNTKPAYGAFSTEMSEGKWLEEAMKKATGLKVVKIPTMGGSVPISPFVSKLGVKAIVVPTVNSDNNQHSANENLRLANYFQGIRIMMGILSAKF